MFDIHLMKYTDNSQAIHIRRQRKATQNVKICNSKALQYVNKTKYVLSISLHIFIKANITKTGRIF